MLAADAILVVELADMAVLLAAVGSSVCVLGVFLDVEDARLDAVMNAVQAALLRRAVVRIVN